MCRDLASLSQMEQTELERKEKIISLMQRSESEREWRKSKNNRQQSLTLTFVQCS